MKSRSILFLPSLLIILIAAFALLSAEQKTSGVMPIGQPVHIKAPLGLPPVPIPADNPPTAETIALGRRLYYDPVLSADNTVSCATCHDPRFGFADPKPVSEGVDKKTGTRNSPPVTNAAYFKVQFWDGRSRVWKSKPKVQCRIRWKWRTRWSRSSRSSMLIPAIARSLRKPGGRDR